MPRSLACAARRDSIAANASKILRICGGLYGNTTGKSMLCTTAVLSASKISSSPFLVLGAIDDEIIEADALGHFVSAVSWRARSRCRSPA